MMKELAAESGANLQGFNHFEKPRDLPLDVIKELFAFLELPPGIIVNSQKREEAVTRMLVETEKLIDKTINSQLLLSGDISIWGKDSLESYKKDNYKQELKELKEFLDSINRFNTVAKLKNINFTIEEIEKYQKSKEIIRELDKIRKLKEALDTNISYLSNTEFVLNEYDSKEWEDKLSVAKNTLTTRLNDLNTIDNEFIRQFNLKLQAYKKEYIEIYLELHKKYRLSLSDDHLKKELMESRKLDNLNKLSTIEGILPLQRLKKIQDKIDLQTCYSLTNVEMENHFVCPHCHFKPNKKDIPVHGVIDHVEAEVESLYKDFTEIIIDSIEDPMIKDNISYLKLDQQKVINKLLAERKLPEVVDNNFITAINTLLKGLEKIEVDLDNLRKAITGEAL